MKRIKRGIHPEDRKEESKEERIKKIFPTRVILPLRQHTGSPSKPLVKVGDGVREGEKIAEASSFVSSPVHASISGKVTAIQKMPHPLGGEDLSIIIEGEKEKRENWENKDKDISSLSIEEIQDKIRQAGIVGLGGAAFPTHVKLTPPPDKPIDTVILNGCECEPYLTGDYRLMLERTFDCIYGLRIIMKTVGAKRGFIAIENNKPKAIALIKEKLKKEKNIKVVPLKTKYPQGAEKMLIYSILKKEVPSGGLPLDVGVVVNNVGTAVAISEAIRGDKPLIERVITVSGSGIRKKANLLVPLGTPFSYIIEECGGLKEEAKKVVMGGPMMGITQYTLDVPVIKGTSGILVLTEEETKKTNEEPCIKCARCLDHCPMGLLPTILAHLVKKEKWEELEKYHIMDCLECGCCSYVCPSKIPLVQLIKWGKLHLQEASLNKTS
ncbi:electron transport complex subunit RsxC [Candidatus Aerophobetes bacterium]|nr:electron transport complex subunit RsxC [Candidatus Aerophobetes bacterium]